MLSGLLQGLWLIVVEHALLAGGAKFMLWFGLILEHHFCYYLLGTQYTQYRPLYTVKQCPPGVNEM